MVLPTESGDNERIHGMDEDAIDIVGDGDGATGLTAETDSHEQREFPTGLV